MDALAELVKNDPSYLVRIRSVESLGFLKMKPDVIELAKKDKQGGVRWSARLAADQLKSDYDYAAQTRHAFAIGIKRDVMGTAKVGQPAPDFTALTNAGRKTVQVLVCAGQKNDRDLLRGLRRLRRLHARTGAVASEAR